MTENKPPFTHESAIRKLKTAQALWNTQDPERVAKAYSPDCIWRNRDRFIRGTQEIIEFLTWKWEKERNYKLRKELFCFSENKIAVQFWYEYQDANDDMKWKRCYGLEDWTYGDSDKMIKRMMSGNDVLLGRNGDGVAVPEEGIEGRWFIEGKNIEDVELTSKHY